MTGLQRLRRARYNRLLAAHVGLSGVMTCPIEHFFPPSSHDGDMVERFSQDQSSDAALSGTGCSCTREPGGVHGNRLPKA
jgi:hypothetical protein